jgi:ABC-type multidrug transport system ATPase subunit
MEPKEGEAVPLGATSIDLEEERQEGWQNKQKGAASVTTTTAAISRSKSSFLNPGGADIPLVELKLENITYTPVTNRASQSTSTCTSRCFDKKQQQHQQQQHTTVLHNISTSISPGKLTAWMGPSGSGKTSLLSIAAGLISPSTTSSSNTKTSGAHSKIYVNGELGRIPKRFVGIVWQEDLLLSNLTVYENIYYAARLKTSDAAATAAAAGRGNATSSSSSDKISKAQVRAVVDETIQELGLTHVRDMLVGNALMAGAGAAPSSSTTNKSSSNKSSSSSSSGNTRRGVSGGERKRVSVACELVVRPSLLLLDEPTSGLDSSMALSLIKTLRYLADTAGHSIAVVIHQPRTTIFNLFDTVLLLSGGHVVYNGPTAHVRTYLESCPDVSPLPTETGIADWIMDVIIHDEKGRRRGNDDGEGTGSGGGGERRLPSCWEEHQQKLLSSSGDDSGTTETPSTSEADDFHNRRKSTLLELQAVPKFETSFRTQLLLLTHRTHKQQRGERLTATAVYVQLVNLFFTALFWYAFVTDGIIRFIYVLSFRRRLSSSFVFFF